MNLHDIRDRRTDPDTQLILDYMSQYQYPQWRWEIDRANPRALQYQVSPHDNWDPLAPRDVLTYLNRARDWELQGRPQR